MAIERQPATPIEGLIEQEPEEINIAIENPDAVSIETEDGGMIIDFDPQEEKLSSEFGDNLVDLMDERDLERIGLELV